MTAKDDMDMPEHSERTRNKARKRVNDHMSRYLKTGGEDGHIWGGVPTLLLTTTGRESYSYRSVSIRFPT